MAILNKSSYNGSRFADDLPVKVLQFGEGNFLRAFIDWMIDEMNKKGLFNGSVSIVQPIQHGMIDSLKEQDYLYTLLLRGIQDGKEIVKKDIISSVSRGFNPYSQFQAYLREAENPELRIIVSNTTEAGIEFRKDDRSSDEPPISFPGKLLRFLKHRYDFFNGDHGKGLLFFPCELIDKNGDTLKNVLAELALLWFPKDEEFRTWLIEANVFFNTLVDRIVSGYPKEEVDELCREFGYEDNLISAGEIFHFLAIEGPLEYEKEFPVVSAGFNVKWCDDITPYRTRKVRILNGAHTMTVLAAYLYGLETVKDCMDDFIMAQYIKKGIFEEIIPTLDLPAEELEDYGNAILERFSNPYIQHFLLSISLNSVSKFKTRVLPSLLEYIKRKNEIPVLLSFSLAALILFYRSDIREETVLKGVRNLDGKDYDIMDSPEVLDFFCKFWSSESDTGKIVEIILAEEDFWGLDLNTIAGLYESVSTCLQEMIDESVPVVLKRILTPDAPMGKK
jgi:tagaturonate reductase